LIFKDALQLFCISLCAVLCAKLLERALPLLHEAWTKVASNFETLYHELGVSLHDKTIAKKQFQVMVTATFWEFIRRKT
jgi:hypothetical protein